MRIHKFFITLPFLCWAVYAHAQESEQMMVPGNWQGSLDVIKSEAQSLMVQNNGLEGEYRQLLEERQKMVQAIQEQQDKNEQMALFLKERHGRKDQAVRLGELTRILKTKRQEARFLDQQLEKIQKKKADFDQKIQQLKYTISDIELHQQNQNPVPPPSAPVAVQPQADDQLGQLRKQLEDENKQEVLLENELGTLKNGDKTQSLNVDAINEENKQLQARLDGLRQQMGERQKSSSDAQLSQAKDRMYAKLKARKEELEAKIYSYELRLDDLRKTSLMTLSWPIKKKKLVHTMAQTDARNNQMRDKIKELREDISILRDQVAKLERRVDFVQGKMIAP